MSWKHKPKHDLDTVIRAIEAGNGTVLDLAQRLGVSWATAKRYLDRWSSAREAMKRKREELVDLAELSLNRMIVEGNWQAVKYVLDSFGRSRGWGVSVEHDIQEIRIRFRGSEEVSGGGEP